MSRNKGWFICGFLSPAVFLYSLFVVWPLIQSFKISFYRWHGVSARKTFVGIQNYQNLAKDPVFHKALSNNLMLLVVGGLITLVIAIGVAHALQMKTRLSKALRSFVLVPQMLSLVVVAILWMFIYNPAFGILTTGMNAVGLGRYVHTWLGESKTALPAVGISFIWYAAGFYVLLFSAGLRSIPAEVSEAAELDGAQGFRRFTQVTWPMLWAIKRVAIVHLTITVMNVFVLVYVMTGGGPDRATEVLLTYLYQSAFTNSDYGYATAIAVANFVVVMILSLMILFAFRRNPEAARA
jgi:N-acetylglucosamine transport system permease protein